MKTFALISTGAKLSQDVDEALIFQYDPLIGYRGLRILPGGCGKNTCSDCGTVVCNLANPIEVDGVKCYQACPSCRPDLFAGLRRDNTSAGPEPTSLLSFQPPGPELTPAPAPSLYRRRYRCPRGHILWTYRLAPLCPIDGCRAKMMEGNRVKAIPANAV